MPFKKGDTTNKARFGKDNPRWNNGKYTDPDGYIHIRADNHPFKDSRGYVLKHRLEMEKKLGRYLTKAETVHHKDGKRDNNNPDNLQVMGRSEHHKLHSLKISRDKGGRFIKYDNEMHMQE